MTGSGGGRLRELIDNQGLGFGQQRTAAQGQQGGQQAGGHGQADHGSYSSKVSRPSRKRAGLSSRRRVIERRAVRLPRSSEMAGSSCPRPCMPLENASLLSTSSCSRVSLVLAMDSRVCSTLFRVRVPCLLTRVFTLVISSVASRLAAVSSLTSAFTSSPWLDRLPAATSIDSSVRAMRSAFSSDSMLRALLTS